MKYIQSQIIVKTTDLEAQSGEKTKKQIAFHLNHILDTFEKPDVSTGNFTCTYDKVNLESGAIVTDIKISLKIYDGSNEIKE